MMNELVINGQEIELEVANDQVWTTSLQIAEVFEKRHSDIIAKIKELPQDDFNERNFPLVEYTDKKGEKRPMYKITKDGFALLAMGFNGQKAYEWKLQYIKAFNYMADKLKNPYQVPKTFTEALSLALTQAKQIEALQAEQKENAPRVAFAQAVEASATSAPIGDWIKTICDTEVKVGRNRAFKWLRDERYLMNSNVPYQKYVDMGYFEVTPQIIVTSKGTIERFITRITAKGQVALSAKIIQAFKGI